MVLLLIQQFFFINQEWKKLKKNLDWSSCSFNANIQYLIWPLKAMRIDYTIAIVPENVLYLKKWYYLLDLKVTHGPLDTSGTF